jgi:ketosteroid isomerase-like protein
MTRTWFLTALLAGACATAHPNPYESQFEARQAIDKFIAAASPKSIPALLETVTDDVYAFDQGLDGKPIRLDGKDAVRRYLEQVARSVDGYEATLSDVHVSATGEAAWIAATWNQKITAGGQTIEWRQLGSFFLRKDATGLWRVAGWHGSNSEQPTTPPPPPPAPEKRR